MKGIVLAGGTGTRLFPSTKVTNKHLLPVFNRPMIFYPIETLKRSGIKDILIVTEAESVGDFMQLLGSGKDFGVDFTYRIQDGAGGVAHALSLAEDFAAGGPVAVILSDNIFEDGFPEQVATFTKGADIFTKIVDDPRRFGVVEMNEEGQVLSLEEKPSMPRSQYAQTGLYLYDEKVFDIIRQVEPSMRGELEITDVNIRYLQEEQLRAHVIEGLWIDAGTHDSLLEASLLAQEMGDPERVALRKEREEGSTSTIQSHVPKVTIGLATHNSEHYLKPCMDALVAQDYKNFEIVVYDNDSSDLTVSILKEKYGDSVRVIEGFENAGFAQAHNTILRATDNDFYACVNVDMIFEPNFISELVRSIDQKPVFGVAGGKVKRWDFSSYETSDDQGKTNFLDSVGLRILRSHRFENIGEGDVDYGQFDEVVERFGMSGSAELFRRKALEDIAFTNEEGIKEYFDESMFMYKEDVDIAYRLQWAGWKCRYTPSSVAYHDRGARAVGKRTFDIIRNRMNKPGKINRLSYLNHHLVLLKNFSGNFSRAVRAATFLYNLKVFFYLLIFETESLAQWWKIFRMRKQIKARRDSMPRRVNQLEIEKFMEG